MTFLKAAFESSLLLRPWVSLAETSGMSIAQWIRESRLLGWAYELASRWGGTNPQIMWLGSAFRFVLTTGVLGLFALLSFSTTGVIGAVTWLLFALVLLGWAFFRPAILTKLTAIDLLVACFLASAVLSTAFSSFFQTSLIGLAKMLTFVAGYVVFRVISENGSPTIAVLMGLLAALGLGESLLGFYQYINHIEPRATWTDPTLNPELQMNRIFGSLLPANPNLLAGFLIPCFAASAGLSLLFFKKKTFLLSLGLIAVAIAILVALVLTGSRGGFLAIGGMLVCMFAYLGHLIWHDPELRQFKWMKPTWIIILAISILAISGGILSSEKIRTRVASIFAMREDSSISYRLNVYNSATQMFKDNPIVGIGPGNSTFKLVYGLYMVPGYNALGAYSVPLEIAVEQGIIGLIIFLSLLLVLGLRTFIALDSPYLTLQQKLLAGALLTGIVGSFMYGIFDTIWYRPSVNLLFWFMVAALAKLTEPQNTNIFKGKL
jgi:putative inorganic carbon (hco3(-)) transporter